MIVRRIERWFNAASKRRWELDVPPIVADVSPRDLQVAKVKYYAIGLLWCVVAHAPWKSTIWTFCRLIGSLRKES